MCLSVGKAQSVLKNYEGIKFSIPTIACSQFYLQILEVMVEMRECQIFLILMSIPTKNFNFDANFVSKGMEWIS